MNFPVRLLDFLNAFCITYPASALPMDELIRELNSLERLVIFLGDGVPVFRDMIAERCQVPYSFAPAHLNRQRAGAVAALGAVYYREGRTQRPEEHQPEYLRVSQAERERAKRLAKNGEA